jgi:hypothetical protein
VTPRETSFVLAALQFALLQRPRGDASLLRGGAARNLIPIGAEGAYLENSGSELAALAFSILRVYHTSAQLTVA